MRAWVALRSEAHRRLFTLAQRRSLPVLPKRSPRSRRDPKKERPNWSWPRCVWTATN